MALDPAARRELALAMEENQLLSDWFNHSGYDLFSEKAKDLLSVVQNIETVKDQDDLNYRKGQIDILKWFLTFPTVLRETLEEQLQIAEDEIQRSRKNG